MSDVVIRPLDIDRDAARLAAMWNDSDEEWPNSFASGVPITEEMIREWDQEDRMLVVFVAEVDGEIAGYCSFMGDHHGLKNEGYVGLLNVSPKYQKRSIGRRLIQATIERSVQEGWRRQTLTTWSANLKAVPTYKKTGHFWKPDSSVWMENYIPGALQLPLTKPFFERHDWYRTMVRDLAQREDEEVWEGLKVYTERWEAGDEALIIRIDREARAPVAVDTDTVMVAVIADEIEPLAGSKVTLHWRVTNKGTETIQIHLHALGDKGLSIDHRDAWSVPAGTTVERTAQVEVAEDAPRSKEDGSAPAVRSLLRVDDREVELFVGLRARKAISLDTAPAAITVTPGVPQCVNLQLHSELDKAQGATLWLTPPEGLTLDWTRHDVEISAKAHLSLPLTVEAARDGVFALPVRVTFDNSSAKPLTEDLTVFSLPMGGLLAHQQGDSVRLETDTLRITALAKNGSIRVEHKAGRYEMAVLAPRLGPPFYPSEFEGQTFDMSLETSSGCAIVHMAAEAKSYRGLYLHQAFCLSVGGIATVEHILENRGNQAYTVRPRLWARSGDSEREDLVLPLREGLLRSPSSSHALAWLDVPRNPREYAEPWIAWTRERSTVGLAWPAAAMRISVEWNAAIDMAEVTLEPGQRSIPTRTAVYLGEGDWRTARAALQRAMGFAAALEEPFDERPAALAEMCPRIIATTRQRVAAHLRASNAANRAYDGEVAVCLPEGCNSQPQTLPIYNLNHSHPCEREIELTLPDDRLGVYTGQVRLTLCHAEEERPFHVLRLGTEAPVYIEEGIQHGQPVWTLENGSSSFQVAPAFCGSVIAWMRAGENQLASSFPDPESFGWSYPVFGGVQPWLIYPGTDAWEGYLHREPMRAEELEERDAQGLPWRGVRLSTRPKKKELSDLFVELDYLTLGSADILKLVYRIRNLRGTEQSAHVGYRVMGSLGAGPAGLTLRGEGYVRRPSIVAASVGGRRWGALTNDANGKTMLLVARGPHVTLHDGGRHGRRLIVSDEARLAGGETREYVQYLVAAESLEAALSYVILQDYQDSCE